MNTNTRQPLQWFGQWPAKLIEKAINEYIALDPEMLEKIAALSGKVIAIEILGLDKTIYLALHESGIKLQETCDKPDTSISGTPSALFKMGASGSVTPLLLKGEIEIRGDTRLGRKFKSLLNEIEVDWEEQLSKSIGDIPAHQIMSALTKFSRWGRAAGKSIAQDISEYLHEESRDVVTGAELEVFNKDVDQLRDSTDRLQTRINQLKK